MKQTRKMRDIECSIYDQRLDVHLGHVTTAEFINRCNIARDMGIELRAIVVEFARSIDPQF